MAEGGRQKAEGMERVGPASAPNRVHHVFSFSLTPSAVRLYLFEHPQRLDHLDFLKQSGFQRQLIYMKRCLPALAWIGEDVVDKQKAACHYVFMPDLVISTSGLH